MRKHDFVIGEYYHIYNRGADKREIVKDKHDLDRLLQSFREFNTQEKIGSLYLLRMHKDRLSSPTTKLVSIIAYCINPNHFHLLLTPLAEKGIEKFMQRIGGYTRYFNEKYERSGVLFQGKFKSKHIDNNEYLLHVSAYINMNNSDYLSSRTTQFSCSSYAEYSDEIFAGQNLCDTNVILEQFENKEKHLDFARKSWLLTQQIKAKSKKELEFCLLTSFLEEIFHTRTILFENDLTICRVPSVNIFLYNIAYYNNG